MIRQRIFLAALICGYIAWDLSFLIRGKIPCSIFKSLTGLPCPTSGCWRSLRALSRGEFEKFFLYNPFTAVFLLLLLASAVCIVYCLLRKKPILLTPWLGAAWIVSLALAWITKFLLSPVYW